MDTRARTAAVVAAAGLGTRFRQAAAEGPTPRADLPKTFQPLRGRPLFTYGVEVLAACPEVAEIAVVAPPDLVAAAREACRAWPKVTEVVSGGALRQDSVLNALRALAPSGPGLVAVHDGARPLATPDLVRRCLESARLRGSGVAALPVTDTLKRADAEGRVSGTLDRSLLWTMQTPQVFRYDVLRRAHEAAAAQCLEATDDAALVEGLGEPVWLVRGEETNLKVTTAADMALAASLLAGREGSAPCRVGHGFDAHRFTPGRPCILGGVEIPHDAGLAGHSDADVATHALMDAILGALGLGDIGRHFPDTDPAYAGISSLGLAARVVGLAADHGYRVSNIDLTIIAEVPRISPHVDRMTQALAAALGCDSAAVSVKATTTEGMGFTGRREGIAAHAVAVLTPS